MHRRRLIRPSRLETSFIPPYEYREWYREMETCVGMQGNFSKISWTVVPHPWNGNDTLPYTHGQTTVRFDSTQKLFNQRTTILVNGDEWRERALVTHEMLHDILLRNGWKPSQEALQKAKTQTDTIVALHPVPPYLFCAPLVMPRYVRPAEPARQGGFTGSVSADSGVGLDNHLTHE
jgi:hypothetical protein